MKILPEDKIGPYLAEAERRGLLAAFYLELTADLRRGELLALLWTDLDVENMTISVSKQVNRINGELVVASPKRLTPSAPLRCFPDLSAFGSRFGSSEKRQNAASLFENINAKKFLISYEIRNFLVETAGLEPVTSCV